MKERVRDQYIKFIICLTKPDSQAQLRVLLEVLDPRQLVKLHNGYLEKFKKNIEWLKITNPVRAGLLERQLDKHLLLLNVLERE